MEFYWSIYFGVAFIIFATNSKHLPFGLEWTECQISSHRDVQRCLLRFEIGCLIRQTTEKLPFSFRINHRCSTFTDIYIVVCVFLPHVNFPMQIGLKYIWVCVILNDFCGRKLTNTYCDCCSENESIFEQKEMKI